MQVEEGIMRVDTSPKSMVLIDRCFLFKKLNFRYCASDANLYVYRKGGKTVVIVIYVDDLLIIGDYEDMI